MTATATERKTDHTVLVINDMPDSLEMMSTLLRKSGYQVLTACDGREGFEVAQAEHPDLILSDVSMPRLDGIELCRLIRRHPELCLTPVLLVSAIRKDSESVVKGLQSGADDYLEAPYDPMRLVTKVAHLIERKHTEEKLLESEERYRVLAETATDVIITIDENNSIQFVNKSVERVFGYTAPELLGQQIDLLMPKYLRELHRSAFSRYVQTGQKQFNWESIEVPGLHKSGREIALEISFGESAIKGKRLFTAIIRDITERKRAEQSRSRLAAIVDSSDDAILSALDGWVTSWNGGAEKMYGYTAAEAVGQHISFIIPPENIEELEILHERVRSGERIEHLETVRVRKDGTRLDVLISLSPLKDERSKVIGVSSSAHDITVRKRAEQALKMSEERYRELVENARDIIYSHDLAGNFTSINKSAERIIGYTCQELLTMNLAQTVEAECLERARRIIFANSNDQEVTVHDLRLIAKDGRRIEVEVNARLVYQDGVAVGVHGIARDVTERKRAEEMIRSADLRAVAEYERLLDRLANLALTFGTARDLLTVYRGLCAFTLSLTHSYALVIFVYDEAKGTREATYSYLNGAELDVHIIVPVRSGPAGQAIKTGLTIVSNDYLKDISDRETVGVGITEDSQKPRSSLIAPMTIMGRTIGTIEVQHRDLAAYTREHVTAMQLAANLAANAIENVRLLELEREKEEQLRQSQKMEAVGKLAGGIAHDFNNLLTAINGYSELTMRKMRPADPLRRNIEEIKKAGDRAAGLTRQLLAFSRKQVMQPKVFDLNTVVAEMEKMLHRLIGEDISLKTALDANLGSIKADPGQIEQVIMNLAVNARDAMPHGGKLTIETANVVLDEEYAAHHVAVKSGSYVMLSVSDTGTGMDEQTQARIFEPFYTTKDLGKGTGLGLSTVYGIVKQSGGNIWVYSEVGQGTAFKIYLPRTDSRAPEYRRSTELEGSLQGNETILLAEDDERVRNLVCKVLSSYGYQILEADSGAAALSICENTAKPIHLLLTDVVMPEMSGRGLADHFNRLRSDSKVLYMSGYTDDAIVHHGVLDADASFIQKPFAPDSLARKVREILDMPA